MEEAFGEGVYIPGFSKELVSFFSNIKRGISQHRKFRIWECSAPVNIRNLNFQKCRAGPALTTSQK